MTPKLPRDSLREWTLLDLEFGFARSFGPVGFRETADQQLELGFRCGDRHLNPLGICHGGPIATFADYAALGTQYAVGLSRIVTSRSRCPSTFCSRSCPGNG